MPCLAVLYTSISSIPLPGWEAPAVTSCLRTTGRKLETLWCRGRELGPTLGVSDSVGLELGLRVRISNKFPGDVAAAGPGTTL